VLNPTAELLVKIQVICKKDPRYKPEVYLFVLAGLHFTVSRLPKRRHVTGQELLAGIRVYGLDQFGPLTQQVFEHWGVKTTEDFGHIVFNLVEVKLLGKTDEDTLEDFRGVYDFSQALNPKHLYQLPQG
jgi:uncharacterized repeat protein (TIGR04138 family)